MFNISEDFKIRFQISKLVKILRFLAVCTRFQVSCRPLALRKKNMGTTEQLARYMQELCPLLSGPVVLKV